MYDIFITTIPVESANVVSANFNCFAPTVEMSPTRTTPNRADQAQNLPAIVLFTNQSLQKKMFFFFFFIFSNFEMPDI